MLKSSKQKGSAGEKAFCQAAKNYGFYADRVPGSGMYQNYKGDVRLKVYHAGNQIFEVKSTTKANGYKGVLDILETKHMVIIKNQFGTETWLDGKPKDARPNLVLIDMHFFFNLIKKIGKPFDAKELVTLFNTRLTDYDASNFSYQGFSFATRVWKQGDILYDYLREKDALALRICSRAKTTPFAIVYRQPHFFDILYMLYKESFYGKEKQTAQSRCK